MRALNFASGFLVGAMLGVGLVLLFTPRSGEELRLTVQDRVNAVLQEGRQAAEQRRLELKADLEARKQPIPRQSG